MKIQLSALFQNHAVLQRDLPLPIWGWGEPGECVTVRLAGHEAQTSVDSGGHWLLRLPPLPAGGPHELRVEAPSGHLEVVDLLVGEVWLCSGQSNMEFPLSGVKNSQEEIEAADHPRIRLFQVPRSAEVTPRSDTTARWEICTPHSVQNFSAVAYFHGLELQRRLDVPVGLINASWGGTMAEAWTSREGLLAEPTLHSIVADGDRLLSIGATDIREEFARWEQTYVQRPTPPNLGFEQGWAGPEGNREGWNDINVPGYWQRAGMNFNGVVWFRRELEIPSAWAGKDLTLSIGACDKSEWTYFNGELIGSLTLQESADAWSMPRVYAVPGRLVRAGLNVVAVRVYSHLYGGGMIGPARLMFVKSAASPEADAISLTGGWICRVEHNFGIIPPAPPIPPGPDNPGMPWVLYAGMIAPLVPYAVRGAIWYQGESNADRSHQYRTLFPALIRDWRRLWGQDHFYFQFVQLANYLTPPEQPGESRWAELREAQTLALALPDTAMAVIIDIGEEMDIHPKNKRDVGNRLAWSALSKIHGLKDVTPSGPLYKACKVEGSRLRLFFDHLGGGLEARGGALKAFAIAGADKRFSWADARIDGDTVVVSNPEVSAPVAVRYGWADNPPCNLYNRAGLPAAPFRTDDWLASPSGFQES